MDKSGKKFKQFLTVTFITFCFSCFSQTKSSETLNVKILSQQLIKDTVKANGNIRRLIIAMEFSGIPDLKSLTLQLVNKKGTSVADIGNYQLKKHEKGFYFFEDNEGQKISFLNNVAYFIKTISIDTLKEGKEIKVTFVSLKEKKEIIWSKLAQ